MAGHVCSFVSNSLQPHRLQPTRLLGPWEFPGKNTGVDCHFLLWGILLTQAIDPVSPALAGGFFTTGATLEGGDLIPSPMKREKDPSCKCSMKRESESHSVVSWLFATPWTVCCPGNSPGQNTGVGSFSLLQGDLPKPGIKLRSHCTAGGFFTSWATSEAQEYWSQWPIPSPEDLPDPEMELESPAL